MSEVINYLCVYMLSVCITNIITLKPSASLSMPVYGIAWMAIKRSALYYEVPHRPLIAHIIATSGSLRSHDPERV